MNKNEEIEEEEKEIDEDVLNVLTLIYMELTMGERVQPNWNSSFPHSNTNTKKEVSTTLFF